MRLRDYYKSKLDRFRDDYESRLNATALTVEPTSPTFTPTERSESPAQRLAQIPQWRWRLICATFWLCVALLLIVVHWAVDQFWPGSTPDDAVATALSVAAVLVLAFSTIGAVRTNRIDPDDRTTLQGALKYFYEHLGDG